MFSGTFWFICLIVLWMLIHGPGQLFCCFRFRKLYWKCIPVWLVLLELCYTAFVYFDPFNLSSGWDALAALIVGAFVAWAAAAVFLAWLVYGGILWYRKRKARFVRTDTE